MNDGRSLRAVRVGDYARTGSLTAMGQHATFSLRRAGSPGARLLVLLATLAGLFAMHGLSDHGTMGHDSPSPHQAGQVATMETDATPVSGLHRAATGAVDDHDILSGVVVAMEISTTEDVLNSGAHVAMGLCLALLAAAVALALRRLPTQAHPLTPALLETMQQPSPARARVPDPPNLHALSIQRC